MTTLADLKNQQGEIREMTTALLNLLSPEQQAVGTIAQVTHTLLCDLCDKVNQHLAEEHQGVFPELLSHGDQSVQNMVWGFINNDKPLRVEFRDYQQKWLKHCEYAVSADFIRETKQILETLEARMQLEDSKMMPKLEAAGMFATA
jgi:regulator of sigma D